MLILLIKEFRLIAAIKIFRLNLDFILDMGFFCWSSFVIYVSCMSFIAALWSSDWKGLTSYLSSLWCFLVILSFSHVVSWVMFVFVMPSFLFFAIISWKRADLLALLCVVFSCVLSLSHAVFRVRYGIWFAIPELCLPLLCVERCPVISMKFRVSARR